MASIPEMISVQSSHLERVGYDKQAQELYVEFKDGSLYCYTSVSEETYDELVRADSVGKFFHAHIYGQRNYRKIR